MAQSGKGTSRERRQVDQLIAEMSSLSWHQVDRWLRRYPESPHHLKVLEHAARHFPRYFAERSLAQ